MHREDNTVASIVVCTLNRVASLAETLAAMRHLEVPPAIPAELIIVDNASADATAEVVQQCRLPNMPVRYVSQPERGKARSCNAGIAAARGQVFLCTDDDVRPPVNWIGRMCTPILNGQADAVAGGVRMAQHLERPWMTPLQRGWLASTDTMTGGRPGTFVGANLAFSRKVLAKVPAFDPNLGPGALGFCEDGLFCMQLNRAGFKSIFALDVIVEHHFDPSRLSRGSFLKRAETEGRSSAYVAHHWVHERITVPRLRLLKHQLQLSLLRRTRWRECREPEGMPEWEMLLVKEIAFYKEQLLNRKRRNRNYEQFGLVRRSHSTSEQVNNA